MKKNDVLKANIELHTQLSCSYKEAEPHYKPENVQRVRNVLKTISGNGSSKRLLDVGCGMGFIIDIAKEFYQEICGVDITPAMIEKVNKECKNCQIDLRIAEAEDLPFENNSFDTVSAFAFLHHLYDLRPALEEIFRVLKKGGILYSDTDPNFYFWQSFNNIDQDKKYSDIVDREINGINYKDKELKDKYNVEPYVLNTAESLKHKYGGFKEDEIKELLYSIGFSKVEINYEWFLGEAKLLHRINNDKMMQEFRDHLKEMLPLSRHLFKYIQIFAKK